MHIHELPEEILCKTFLFSLPARDEMRRDEVNPIRWGEKQNRFNRSISTPLSISHVCRRWRGVSLAFGDLWSHLYIRYISHYENDWSGQALEIVTEWLERTRGRPLNFTIHCTLGQKRGQEGEHSAFECIITTLLSEQHRWCDVDFWWSYVKVSSDFPGVYCTHMPALVSLSLNHNLAVVRQLVKSCIDLSSSRKLAFLDLSICSNLSFHEDENSSHSGALRMEETSPVRTLDLPSLKYFAYNFDADDYNGRQIFSSFIRNALPPLTVLDVAGYFVHEDILVPALKLLTALEEFRIHLGRLRPKFFRMLMPDKRNGPKSHSIVCPSLRKIYLIDVNDPDDDGSESWDETENMEDESEPEEEMGIGNQINKEHGGISRWNGVQHNESSERRPAPHLAFIGALCAMVEWRFNYLNTLRHIWVYTGEYTGWNCLLIEHGSRLCNKRIMEDSFQGNICIESAGHEPPHPKDLQDLATSLPD